jgi:beta-N-acetylhexosaminidase
LENRAFICGLEGLALTEGEREFISRYRPWGAILFARNIGSPPQVHELCNSFRECLDDADAPIFIDQEGGRVQRIKPPNVRAYPAGSVYGDIYKQDVVCGVEASRLGAKLIGLDLISLGITGNCLPLLDMPVEDSDPVIGDRAYGRDIETVATIGTAVIGGLASAGVLPVMKHLPGHGRACVDSHKALPVVDCDIETLDASDFVPFRLNANRVPLAMSAHIIFSAVDDENPATLSAEVIDMIIRGRIGYSGALMTDDISMGALSGSLAERTRRAIEAGCDLVLHCNGVMEEMVEVAENSPVLAGDALIRTESALAWREGLAGGVSDIDQVALSARLDALIGKYETADV